jgi:outer membrane protein OmpA-like peptidoglycan-associated protein
MRLWVVLGVLGIAALAVAAPADLQLIHTVPAGKKPFITITATEAITSVQLEVERVEDHKRFSAKAGPLKVGDKVDLAMGDGKAGRAHWKGKLTINASSGTSSSQVDFESTTGAAAGGLHIGYDRAHLDLDKGRLQFTVTRPIASARLVVVNDDGEALPPVEVDNLGGQKPGQWLTIDWKPTPKPVLRLELTVKTADGDAVIAKLVPWSVAIAHQEVVFASGESAIAASEAPKLEASYQKIVDAIDKARRNEPSIEVKLFIAGHTDTVGSADDNRKLSQARARSIGKWFHDKGLKLPVYYAGFGEDQLKVKTADNTDEARNRRADYVVGVEEPLSGRGKYALLK